MADTTSVFSDGVQAVLEATVRAGHVDAPDEVAPDGVAPDGVAPDGVAPDGVAPDGVAKLRATTFRASGRLYRWLLAQDESRSASRLFYRW